MTEYVNPLSFKTVEVKLSKEDEEKIESFITEIAAQAATILADRHLVKGGKLSINYVKQKQKLGEELTKLLRKNNNELANALFVKPKTVENANKTFYAEAAKKLADLAEKSWVK
ncbi:MAG: hypothetical protein WAV15_00845 [Minisyncoccia bacterium]